MKHLSVIAPKDGWVLLVSFHANMGLQLVTIFACVIYATMVLPVTCCVQIIVRCVWVENVTADFRVGEDRSVRRKGALDTRKIARDMDNV